MRRTGRRREGRGEGGVQKVRQEAIDLGHRTVDRLRLRTGVTKAAFFCV